MKYNITYQEAYAYSFNLNADFEYKGKKYKVTSTYYNGSGIEDIDVYNEDDSCIEDDALEDNVLQIGKEIIENMDIEKHLTYWKQIFTPLKIMFGQKPN